MADTADRRSEGVRPNAKNIQYKENKYSGICVHCRQQGTMNRSYCYDCSNMQTVYSARYHLRKLLEVVGVETEDALRILQIMKHRESVQCNFELLESLEELLVLSRKRKRTNT